MILTEDLENIGKFQKTHALRGELNALLDLDEDFFDENKCIILDMEGVNVPFFVESVRQKGKDAFLVKIQNVDSEQHAKRFVNKDIFVEKSALRGYSEDFDDEEGMFSSDFEGFKIIDISFGEIGVIENVDLSTDNILFEVVNGEEEILIPVAEEYIVEMDIDDKILKVDLPQGLLELNKK